MLTPSRMEWVKAWEQGLAPSPAARRSAARAAARVNARRYYGRAATAPVLDTPQPAKVEDPVPVLRVVRKRQPLWKVALLVVVTAAVFVALCFVTPVLLRAATADTESALGELQVKKEQLKAETLALDSRVSSLCSPFRVSEQAAQLGLGPAQSVHYLELPTAVAAAEEIGAIAGR